MKNDMKRRPNIAGDNRKPESGRVVRTMPDELQKAVETIYAMGQLCRALGGAKAALEAITEVAACSVGLTLPHWIILTHLLDFPACRQVDLKSRTNFAPPHLSRLVEELVARGFVRRYRHSQDRRQSLLTVTPAGRKVGMNMLESLSTLTDQEWLSSTGEARQLLEGFISNTQNGSHEFSALISRGRQHPPRSLEQIFNDVQP